jgi:VCBS repeat-containing protein
MNANGSFTFTPNPGFAGSTTFTYRASDGTAQSAPATVTINVTDFPDPPTANNDTYTAVKNTPMVVSATATGTTTEEILPYGSADWHYFDSLVPANRDQGTAWRTDAYTENADWEVGAAELGYGDGDEATQINDNPDPAFDSGAGDKFTTYYFRRTLDIADAWSITGVNMQLRYDDGAVIYFNGTEVGRTANMGAPGTEVLFDQFATGNINDNSTQDFPLPASALLQGGNLIATEVHQNTSNSSDLTFDLRIRLQRLVQAGLLANDTDPDPGQTATLTAEVVAQPAHGALVLNPNGTFTYTPANGYTGPDSFTYRAKDSTDRTSGVATANITVVTGPNVPPVANGDSYTTNEDAPLNVSSAASGVLQNDTDAEGDAFTAAIARQPANGTVTLNANGTFLYTPNPNFFGTDTFTYRAVDTRPSAPATVTITVNSVNDAPVAVADSYAGDPGVPFVVAAAQGLLVNDSDVDPGAALTAQLVTAPATGTLTLNPDGSFTFTAAQGGTYNFTYRANDGTANSNTVTVTVRLNAVPVTQPDSYTTDEDAAIHAGQMSVLANDSDPEGQPLTAALVADVQHGTLDFEPDGSFHYTPAANYFGPDSFTYTATDGVRTSAPVTVNITVNAVNDPPVAVSDVYGVRVDTTLDISDTNGVLRNDTDVDNTTLTVSLITAPVDGTLTLNPDGSFSYAPAAGFSGARSFQYRISDGSLLSQVATVTLNVSAALNTIAISEIMYNPPGTAGADEEFLEIYNYGDAAVDLTGWAFTKGVDYAFEAGVLLPGRSFMAIPANKAAFTAKYPAVTAVTATGWSGAGSLANGGELVRLKNALDEVVDEVEYSDQGDWAVRKIVNIWDATNTPGAAPPPVGNLDTDPGLDWQTAADPDLEHNNPGGASIQLINPVLSNNAGQNWVAATPTPGAANSVVAQANSAPLIRDVVHSPAVPNRTEQVYVTARITDEQLTGYGASVFYRTWQPQGTNPNEANFIEQPMADNGLRGDGVAGDNIFGAVIPAQSIDTVVEFYVRSADAGGNVRTWPAPTLDLNGANPVQNANCLYQVNEESWTDARPLYQLVLTGADNAAFNAGLNDRQTNVGPNCTVIFRQGGDIDVRYLGTIRPRGNSSRSDTPMNLRMDIPGDNPWNGRTAFTLNYKFSYSQFLGARFLESAGVPCEVSGVVGMRLNGLNRLLVQANGQPGPNGVRTFGMYCDLIPRGGDVVDRWFPDDNDGNAYGKIRAGFGGARWQVSTLPTLDPVTGYAVGGYVNEGYWKQTNGAQNDWTDLHAWMQSLQQGTNANFHTVIANTVDIEQWCRLLAMTSIINHGETNMTNGDDDDYSVYFGADRKCRIIAHDLDTCFNLNAIGLGDETAPPTVSIYQCTDPNFIDNATLTQMDKFYRNPVTGRKFKAALRQYLDTLFAKPEFDATIDRLLDTQWMGSQFTPTGDQIRAHIKSYMDQRRATIETFLPRDFTATTTLAVQNGFPTSTSATDLGSLGGKIDPARTAAVKVNGVEVTTNPYGSTGAADNSWSAGTAVTLTPGLNTLVCTAHDESGAVFATQTVTIWYQSAGTNKSGTLAASETWSAAAGPYNLTANLTVPNNMVLTIEPGTTVFVATGSGISVTGGGRIVAAGTAAKGIRFQILPSGTGTWNGITISGATATPSEIGYATFNNNGDTAIHAQNGANVVLHHLTFLNPAEPFIEVDASSFHISDCVFPNPSAGFEPVHGSGGIAAGGRGIIERCHFGKTIGYNDSIDFTGGNRPGPILHIRDCVFNGSDDDILDFDSTDAWIERCVFLHAHRNGSPDSASAISGGSDNADYSQLTVLNCLFYDCDNAITLKQGNQPQGGSGVLLYNTIVHTTKTGGEDTASGVVNYDDENVNGEGKGFRLEGNIIWDAENLTRDWVPANSALVLVNNFLPAAAPAEATASGNVVADPKLNLALIPNPATATPEQVIAALQPLPCSPALGFGADLDAAHRSIRVSAPPAAVWPPAVTLGIGPGGSFTPTGQPAWDYGFTHYKYVLDGGSESPEFAIATPLALSGLAVGNHSLTILAKADSGVWVDGGYTLSFAVAADAPTVVLSEVLAAPVAGNDFIELHNYGTTPANVAGCSIFATDGLPNRFTFPAGSSIPGGGRIILENPQLGFNINRSGESIHFQSAGGTEIDSVTFGPQITGFTVARFGKTWVLSTPTPGTPNAAACEIGTGSLVRINEWLGNNDLAVSDDFVELYNGEPKPVSIAGWSLTDDYRNEPEQNVFPALSFLPASGFLELVADGDTAAGSNHLSFAVSRIHDGIALLSPAGAIVDNVVVLPGNPDVSQGRTPDGGINIALLTQPTPGFSNSTDLSAENAVINGLRITELMFAPPGGSPEYVEFRNIGAANLTITGVTFGSGLTFTFPAVTLAAGGYAVITNDLAAFNVSYPGVSATQWTAGRLDNTGESLRLETGAVGLGILDFRYEGDWYPVTRSGASLEFIDPVNAARSAWDLKTSWQPAVPSPGGPGVFGVFAPLDFTMEQGGTAILQGFVYPGVHSPGSITVAWSKVSGPGNVQFTAPANRDTDAQFSAAGVYELRFTATPPTGAPASDSVIVTVEEATFESYAAWTARTLGTFPPAQQTASADPDLDGVPNGVEHVMGTNPAVRTAGPELILNNGRLALRYNVSDNIDPAIQVIPQIGDALGNWQQGAAFLTESVSGTLHTATDNNNLGASVKKFMRLKVIIPQP